MFEAGWAPILGSLTVFLYRKLWQTVALHCLDTILCLKRTAAAPLNRGYSAVRVPHPNKGLNLHVSLRPEFTFFITADFRKCFTTHAGATIS